MTRHIICSPRLLFPLSVLVLYLVLWGLAPEETWWAMKTSVGILCHVLPSLFLVFLLMAALNLFLNPARFLNALGKKANIRRTLLAAAAGILSAGPIYAWYPMLRDLREKGAGYSLLAIFLVNRAVKPFLLPVMVSLFGGAYVLILTLLTIAGSFLVGIVVGLVDSPSARSRTDH